VLLVDDDRSFLRAAARLIRCEGFTVSTFDNPADLLASETAKKNACLIADVHMSGMNGIELANALVQAGRGLPFILITGRNDSETQRLIDKADPVTVLFKPIDDTALFAAIDRALKLSRGSAV